MSSEAGHFRETKRSFCSSRARASLVTEAGNPSGGRLSKNVSVIIVKQTIVSDDRIEKCPEESRYWGAAEQLWKASDNYFDTTKHRKLHESRNALCPEDRGVTQDGYLR